MLNPQHPPPTRQAVVILHAELYRRSTGTAWSTWAELVDAKYCELLPADQRCLPAPNLAQHMNDARLYASKQRAWETTLRRYASDEPHDPRFPAELEEAWVRALPDPFRTACVRELAQRYGLYGAPIRDETGAADHEAWGLAMQEFGELTQQMGKVLMDGRIDERDLEHLPELISRVRSAQAELESVCRKASSLLDRHPMVVDMHGRTG